MYSSVFINNPSPGISPSLETGLSGAAAVKSSYSLPHNVTDMFYWRMVIQWTLSQTVLNLLWAQRRLLTPVLNSQRHLTVTPQNPQITLWPWRTCWLSIHWNSHKQSSINSPKAFIGGEIRSLRSVGARMDVNHTVMEGLVCWLTATITLLCASMFSMLYSLGSNNRPFVFQSTPLYNRGPSSGSYGEKCAEPH